MEGLGDIVKKVTELTGISYVAAKIAGDPEKTCTPCEERRKKLNQMFPFNQKK